jgi:hypothetical protein
MDQKKKTTFKYNTRRMGGTKARFTTVAGTQSFPAKEAQYTSQKLRVMIKM